MIPHNRLTFDHEEVRAVWEVVRSGNWVQGEKVQELETLLAEEAGVKYAIAVNSGSAALRVSLLALGIKPGDRVIVPAYCCVALPNAVLSCGAVPVLVDVDDSWNLDLDKVKEQLNCKAALVVNTFGLPAKLPQGIPVIEDCAHGFGMGVGDGRLGGRSELAVLSLHATKLLGAGEGGAVLTNSPEYAEKIRRWREYENYAADACATNLKMSDIHAALAVEQMGRLPGMCTMRALAAQYYDKKLQGCSKIQVPNIKKPRIWYRYAVLVPNALEAKMQLRERGVVAELPVIDWRRDSMVNLPYANWAYGQLLSLPLYPSITVPELRFVADALRGLF